MKQLNLRHYEFLKNPQKIESTNAFLIYGPENFYKDKILSKIENHFTDETSRDFDHITFYGDECSGTEIVEQLESLPFLAETKVVVIKNYDKMIAQKADLIATYLQNQMQTSILIIVAEKIDKRKSAGKLISQHCLNIECKQPYNSSELVRWLRDAQRARKFTMENSAVNLFANSIETNYFVANNELEKLLIYTKNARNITVEDVENVIGKTKTNTVFELQNSLGQKNLKKALTIIENMFSSTDDKIGIFVISMLTRFFLTIWKVNALQLHNLSNSEITSRHLNEVFYKFRGDYIDYASHFSRTEVKQIFSLLLKADAELKSLPLTEKIILEPLIINICRISKNG